MTEHDTPSTAHTEGEFTPTDDYVRDAYVENQTDVAMCDKHERHAARFDRWLAAHDEQTRAQVLAQVREGLEALPEHRARQNTSYGYKEVTIIERADALAVVGRLEGEQ